MVQNLFPQDISEDEESVSIYAETNKASEQKGPDDKYEISVDDDSSEDLSVVEQLRAKNYENAASHMHEI